MFGAVTPLGALDSLQKPEIAKSECKMKRRAVKENLEKQDIRKETYLSRSTYY